MKVKCPHCQNLTAITFKQADSGDPLICPKCGKSMRRPGWENEDKVEQN